jgi:hypothetical protein
MRNNWPNKALIVSFRDLENFKHKLFKISYLLSPFIKGVFG